MERPGIELATCAFNVVYETICILGGIQFLLCDAMHSTVLVIVILSVRLSVCLSVRLSVTLVHCVHMVQPTITIFSPHGSPIILVSGDIKFIPKFEGDHPERGR